MKLSIRAYGIERFRTSFTSKKLRIRNPEPAFELIHEDIMEIEFQMFQSQGRRGGGSWAALAPSTLRRKAAENKDMRILFEDWDLFFAMTRRGDSNQIWRMNKSGLTFGARVPGAYKLFHGGPQPRGGYIPARPYIRFTTADKQRFRKTLAGYLLA